jgi:N utilization substance protein B
MAKTFYTLKGSQRHASRLVAIQMMYQIDQGGAYKEEVIQQYISENELPREGDVTTESGTESKTTKREPVSITFIEQLLNGVYENRDSINERIQQNVQSNFDRLPLILHEILEMAVYEMVYAHTPPPIAINEYVEITKDFFNEDEQAFVNGVLDSIAKNIPPHNAAREAQL